MESDLSKLWIKRVKAFWKEAGIYWSYAARSGLTAFLLLFFIIGTYAYMKILQVTPADYPYWRVAGPVLAVVLAISPLRTFLTSADSIFLMPAELRLRGYWLRSIGYSFLFQAAAAAAALLLIWPLYSHCEAKPIPFAAALLLLLAFKLLAVVSRFHEGRLIYPLQRALAGLIRWIASVIVPFVLFMQGLAYAWCALLLMSVIMAAIIRSLPKHTIPWEYWIPKEAAHMKAHYTFFSWFADVPKMQVKLKPRMALARQLDRMAFHKKETYRYLYAKTFIRSEWFDILARIIVVAVFLLLTLENAVAEPLIYAVALLMSSATASSLEQSHRYSFWLELYPVSKSLRVQAIVDTCQWALISANLILGPALILLHDNKLNALAAVAAGFAFILYYTRVSLRKRASARDD